jgi:hypothetical protein
MRLDIDIQTKHVFLARVFAYITALFFSFSSLHYFCHFLRTVPVHCKKDDRPSSFQEKKNQSQKITFHQNQSPLRMITAYHALKDVKFTSAVIPNYLIPKSKYNTHKREPTCTWPNKALNYKLLKMIKIS